jgi:WD40 repeat protein
MSRLRFQHVAMTELERSLSFTDIKLEPTPTIAYNNLATCGDGVIAYVSNEDVYVLRGPRPSRLTQAEAMKAAVTSINSTLVRGRGLLGFTNRFGATVFDIGRDCAIASFPNDASLGEARGIAVTDRADGTAVFAVGTTQGTVSFFTVDHEFKVTASNAAQLSSAPITSIASGAGVFAATDSDGGVFVVDQSGSTLSKVSFAGDCATAVGWAPRDTLLVGFGSGTIRLLDASCTLLAAVGAHSRWVTSVAVDMSRNQAASVAEDGLLCVWALPQSSDAPITLRGYKVHPDALLTGCAFRSQAPGLCVSTYDSDALRAYDTHSL